ncbi:head decoration protein [Roseomonas sp. USHLN139]|uniref:head decoration protein n=1 Tax=Roseomonas sp. USHLN139 TaxID=3081298 RepID=UPI003B01E438
MPFYQPGSRTETYQPDNLIAGTTQLVSADGILILGQNLKRGALVGRITASGKLTLSASASGDGSQVPYGILIDDVDATAADTKCGIYVKGEFNQNAVTFGTGHTASSVYDVCRDAGLFLKPATPA